MEIGRFRGGDGVGLRIRGWRLVGLGVAMGVDLGIRGWRFGRFRGGDGVV